LRPHPGRSLDSLNGGIIAALRGFMLHAPLTKLSPEAERRQLATALNAICHETKCPCQALRNRGRRLSEIIMGITSGMAHRLYPRIRSSHIKYREHECCEFNLAKSGAQLG